MVPSRDRVQPSGAPSSEEWGQGLRRGDPEAVRRVRERVRRIVAHRGLGIPVHERDDLEQEVMADLWQGVNRAGFDFKAGFWGFVEVVASRRCIDWLRSRRGLVPVAESLRDRAKGPYERVLEGERSEIASRVLQSLDPACREIVIMRLHEGLSYGEMARKLGRSEGALRVQMYRCIQRAQHIVDEVAGASGRDVEKGTSDEPQ